MQEQGVTAGVAASGTFLPATSAPLAAEPNESAVMARLLRARDPRGLELLYDRFGATVYGLNLAGVGDAGLAEEITMDVFARAWQAAERYDPPRGSLATWILRIARNAMIDALRSRARRPRTTPLSLMTDEFGDGLNVADSQDVADETVREEQRLLVRSAVAQLPTEQRGAVALLYFNGYTQAEIARAQKAPISTVKTRLQLGLRKLAIILRERGLDQEV